MLHSVRKLPIKEIYHAMRQSIVGLTADLLGLFAGFILATNINTLIAVKWSLLVFPGILTVRGVVNGIFCARLSTSLHIGSINTSFLKNTRNYYALVASLLIFSLFSAFFLSLVTIIIYFLVISRKVIDIFGLLVCVTNTMVLAFLITNPLSSLIAFQSYIRGLNPDIILYPIMSTVADIVVSFCYTSILKLYLSDISCSVLKILFFVIIILMIFIVIKFYKNDVFRTTLRESLISLVIVILISSTTGIALKKIEDVIKTFKPIYFVYPAVIDTVGDVGSIVGSVCTTKLALGEISPKISSYLKLTPMLLGSWLSSLIIFLLFSLSSLIITKPSSQALALCTRVLFSTNLMAIPLISALSYFIAIIAYKRGLDPDNFVNPIESSLADALTSYLLLLSLILSK